MKEIGGYLELDQLVDRPFYAGLIELNTGRNALLYLIRARSIKKIYIPHLLCESITGVLDQNKIDYEYYSLDQSFML